MKHMHDGYEVDDSRQRFDIPRVRRWMLTTYWWKETATVAAVERACANSAMLIGAYRGDEQVGCCRIVSDRVRFAWVSDVFVTEAHRGKGLARAMVRFAVEHPDMRTIARFLLATKDAHDVYAEIGFAPPPDLEWFMQHKPRRD
jgi:GNAT superfamily N-acetyltransferase